MKTVCIVLFGPFYWTDRHKGRNNEQFALVLNLKRHFVGETNKSFFVWSLCIEWGLCVWMCLEYLLKIKATAITTSFTAYKTSYRLNNMASSDILATEMISLIYCWKSHFSHLCWCCCCRFFFAFFDLMLGWNEVKISLWSERCQINEKCGTRDIFFLLFYESICKDMENQIQNFLAYLTWYGTDWDRSTKH